MAGHTAGDPLECFSIPLVLNKDPEQDELGNAVTGPDGKQKYRCGFRIGGGIDQDNTKSPQGYPDKKMVGMSNAERQKKYRERKKEKEGEEYLKREVQRVKRYYVPTSELSNIKLLKRRKKIKESMQKSRLKANESSEQPEIETISQNGIESPSIKELGPCDSTTEIQPSASSSQSRISSSGQQLFVKMNFNRESCGTKRKRRKNKS